MTTLDYLNDTYLFKSEATLLEIKDHELGTALILDKTIFYPQGGGQPSDTGSIMSGKETFTVKQVRLDKDGTVWHFGDFKETSFSCGDKVTLEVNEKQRIIHSQLHSAGHLIDCAITEMQLDPLKPIKGYHFLNGPYVEYEGIITDTEKVKLELETRVNQLIKQRIDISAINISSDEAIKQNLSIPEGKSARIIEFTGYEGCGCGGTHVKNTFEIGKITIRKIKSKKGNTRISYNIE